MAKTTRDQWLWVDPDPGVGPGMLLSDRIEFYAQKKYGMIFPFKEKNLKPASYRLTLGDLCYLDGRYGNVEAMEGQTLVLQPNSFTIVTVAEKLNMPAYIAGRFNLKIKMIYQGLLLGTGPQVDPGFSGQLSIPLHNISSREIRLKLGDSFATIDFIKTTPFVKGGDTKKPFEEFESLAALRENESKLKGLKRYGLKLFPTEKLARHNIHDYIRAATGSEGTVIVSSVEETLKTARQARDIAKESRKELQSLDKEVHSGLEKVRSESRLKKVFEIVVVVAVLGVVGGGAYFWFSVYMENAAILDKAREIVRPPTARLEEMQDRIDDLSRRVQRIEAEKGAIPRGPALSPQEKAEPTKSPATHLAPKPQVVR